ncbi:type II TA system antitoxin MqsA family protein [Prosthecobacter sp. SYSU 5D2]|uniref:type II TA system antitoxin MqsA family protein n=1 Tax=Prosthecobacter sp. SYSU 5D2 TaxID=3134134 RepID=UPI0031FE9BAC
MKVTITHRREVREQKLAEECPGCGEKAVWRAVTRVMPQEFRGQILSVETGCQECSQCGFAILTDAQIEGLRKSTLKAYQEHAGLMTGGEIIAARKQKGWSQADLAAQTGLGIASIKRWELGLLVQTEANDQALRRALTPALEAGFQRFHLPMAVVKSQGFTETWKLGWQVKAAVVQRQTGRAPARKSSPNPCWDSPLALA